jgi:hypothetical protein
MIHFFWSVFFLVLTMGLVLAYLAAGVLVIWGILWVIVGIARLAQPERTATLSMQLKNRFFFLFNRRVVTVFTLILVSWTIIFYVNQRQEWLGKDNAYHTAKEYYVAGQPLFAVRKFLSGFSRSPGIAELLGLSTFQRWIFMNPDHPVMWPLNSLQRWIYNKGVKHIPETDGEWAVWYQGWFLYPYSKKLANAWDCNGDIASPGMIRLLDATWNTLEGMATLTFADHEVERQYLKNFPALAFYYYNKHGFYANETAGSTFKLIKQPRHVNRAYAMIEWLLDIEQKWSEDYELYSEIKKKPIIELGRQETLLLGALDFVLLDLIHKGEFECSNHYLQLYIKIRNEFVGDSRNISPIMKLSIKDQQELHYDLAINSITSRFYKRVLKWYCNIDVAGEESFKDIPNWDDKAAKDETVKSVYHTELQLIEEAVHGLHR